MRRIGSRGPQGRSSRARRSERLPFVLVAVLFILVSLLAVSAYADIDTFTPPYGDTFILGGDYSDQNFCSEPWNFVGDYSGTMYWTFILFGWDIPDEDEISSATLRLYMSNIASGTFYVQAVERPAWEPCSLVMDDYPAFYPSPSASETLSSSDGGWVEFNVTAIVEKWQSGDWSHRGFVVSCGDGGHAQISGHTGSAPAELIIEHAPPSTIPTRIRGNYFVDCSTNLEHPILLEAKLEEDTLGHPDIAGEWLCFDVYYGGSWHQIPDDDEHALTSFKTDGNGIASVYYTPPDELGEGVFPIRVRYEGDAQYEPCSLGRELTLSMPDWLFLYYMCLQDKSDVLSQEKFSSIATQSLDFSSGEPFEAYVLWDHGTLEDRVYLMEDNIVWQDGYTYRVNYWKASDPEFLAPGGEFDTGDVATLEAFIDFATEGYVPDNVCLVISNHGEGVYPRAALLQSADPALSSKGIVYDGSTSYLTIAELGQGTSHLRSALGSPFEVLHLDACLMQMMEVACEVDDDCEFVVGSESLGWAVARPFDASGSYEDEYLEKVSSGMEARDLALAIAQDYFAIAESSGATCSVLDMSDMANVLQGIDALGNKLISVIPNRSTEIDAARTATQKFTRCEKSTLDNDNIFLDLYDLVLELSSRVSEVGTIATALVIDLANLVEWESHTLSSVTTDDGYLLDFSRGTYGTSIFFPVEQWPNNCLSTVYFNYINDVAGDPADLSFGNETSWMKFLRVYLEDLRGLRFTSTGVGAVLLQCTEDAFGDGEGTTEFSRYYATDTIVSMTAPSPIVGLPFDHWEVDGAFHSSSTTTTVQMDDWHDVVAVYGSPDTTPPPAPIGLTATPSGWTNSDSFQIDWTNSSDPSGIAAAWYKKGTTPTSPTDGTRTTSKPFPTTAGSEGGQTLYVWLEDGAGNKSHSNRSTTTLHYDGTSPSCSLSINNGAASTDSLLVTLYPNGSDTGGSSLSEMRFSNNNSTWSPWEAYGATKDNWDLSSYGGNTSPGTKTTYCQVRDAAGNVSSTCSDTINYEGSAFEVDPDSVIVPEGGSNTFQVRLSAEPSSVIEVTVSRVSGDADITVTNGSGLTFTTANWDDYQTVTISAAEDPDTTSDSATIRVHETSGEGIPDRDVTATEVDNDEPAALLDEPFDAISEEIWEFVHPPYHRVSIVDGQLFIDASSDFTQGSGVITKSTFPSQTTVEFLFRVSYLSCMNKGQSIAQFQDGELHETYHYATGPNQVYLYASCDGNLYLRSSAGHKVSLGAYGTTAMSLIRLQFGAETTATLDGNETTIPFSLADYHIHFGGHVHDAYYDSLVVATQQASTAAVFRVDYSGDVYADRTIYAEAFGTEAADLAEWVAVSEQVEAGDVLALDPDHPHGYRLSTARCTSLVAGVVSSQPGVILGAGQATEESTLLALAGIVPVKVTNEGGPILPGDLLVASSTPGHAMRWDGPEPCPCALVGKALEPMTEARGMILVLLTAH